MIADQGEVALVIAEDPYTHNSFFIEAVSEFSSCSPRLSDISLAYLSACDSRHENLKNISPSLVDSLRATSLHSISPPIPSRSLSAPYPLIPTTSPSPNNSSPVAIFAAKRKYKPVAQKVRPVLADLPDKFRIVRHIRGDPLYDIPTLSPNPPPFTPTGRYTAERRDLIDQVHSGEFLWPAERDLMHHFMCLQHLAFAWDDSERGRFREDFFPPVSMPVIEHKPWVQRNIPIPPGIYDEVCKLIKTKIAAGVYEPSNSSYRSRWFTVVKKTNSTATGTKLRIVHSLEPLNAVTIQHSGVPPYTDQIAEQFAGRACGGILDLYVGYDERGLDEKSRDYTTFQTPFGAHRLVTLPMGWTNSVPIFHDDVTHILQPEIPDTTIPFIDDVPIRGPATRYETPDGSYETHPDNPGIRRFVWEHFQGANRVVQRMKYCGGTFSGHKATLCAPEIIVVGHRCTYEGRLPEESRVDKIVNWGPCRDLSEVRAFLGTVGVVRIFIRNFAHRAHPLTMLTRKDFPFIFGPEQIAAQDDLKAALLSSPALRPIDYASPANVILAVDTSHLAVGFHLCQCDLDNTRIRYYAWFGSITLNDRESRFSQPKLELYGLFRALRVLKMYLIGIRNLVIEVDARYIKGMLTNPDLEPSASINRWIVSILTFHFTLVHVPGTSHGPDGLSRRPPQPGDQLEPDDDFDDWIDNLYGFMHQINSPQPLHKPHRPLAIFANIINTDDEDINPPLTYADIPRTEAAIAADERIIAVKKWHSDLTRPSDLSDAEYTTFLRYCAEFFIASNKLWKKDAQGRHKLVAPPDRRINILIAAHDNVAHKGFFATRVLVAERFWWPLMRQDIAWFIRSCHLCQIRQTRNVLIPPVVASPAPLFAKMYMDTMHMPTAGGFRYLVQGRCSISHYPEFRMLRHETSAALADWIFEDILCRWGTLVEIVSDNGPAFVKALTHLAKKYHINHIRISGYNSRANGIVERPHFDVRQALFKAVDGDQSKWNRAAPFVFWADRITVRRRMGCSPYFAATGTHPLLPLDIAEATYLLPPPAATLSTTDLIVRRAVALQKRRTDLARLRTAVIAARVKAAIRFETDHQATIRAFNFGLGDLVLIRNTAIEKALNRKMRPRYLGPLLVISQNRGGAYILAELDGSVLDRPIAAFRVIPYFARKKIDVPDLDALLDISAQRLRDMEATNSEDPEEDDLRGDELDESDDETSQPDAGAVSDTD